jgi:tetratricopeptide (TPR) repeat protein
MIFFSCKDKPAYQAVSETTAFLSSKEIPDSHFLGDHNCKECHAEEFKEWKGSHHDKAMQIADSTTVLANFNGEVFESKEMTSRFFKKDGEYYVNTQGPEGEYQDYKIIYTFGITPLQQYIVEFPNGHYQCLSTAWDVLEKKWFNLYPDYIVDPSEWLHWTKGALNWNNMCSDCHSTNVRQNYDYKTDSYNTKYAIINVNCEACHGPGKQHVEDVERLGDNYTDSGTFEMTLNTKPKELVDQCARCHMRREQFSESFNFEGTLYDHYFTQVIDERLYHPDGQILDEVYVYGSFIQSKMYQNNVTCYNCHNSHSLKLRFEGNQLCAQCHLPGQYDTPEHHFHEVNSEGASCIDCHMTGKYYMVNDFRRDHSFRVPRPDLSLKYGTPNACSGCHDDKDDKWAWEEFKKQYGEVDSLHFSDKLAPGITRQPNAHLGLLELIDDSKTPDIARASAAKALRNYNSQNFIDEYLAMLNDESALVRGTSLDVLSEINNTDYVNYFYPLLNDPKRSIRIKAFFALGVMQESQIPEEYKQSYDIVKTEFFKHLNANADFAGGRIKRANYYYKKGNIDKAIKGYEEAIKIDNYQNEARLTLANLYYNNNEFIKAEETFKKVIDQEPDYGPTYYSLGLLYAELERTDDAIQQLAMAVNKMPENTRAYYNLSLLYNKKQDFQNAEKVLINGLKIDNTNESLLYALGYLYTSIGETEKSKNIIIRLVELYPDNPQYLSMLQQLSLER